MVKQLPRSLSFSNATKSAKIRDLLVAGIQWTRDGIGFLAGLTVHTIVLPCLALFPQAFLDILNQILVDRFMQKTLEEAKVLNWCRTARPLTPIQVLGDGNCLLHAASVYMSSTDDKDLALRRLLFRAMREDMSEEMKQRWDRQCRARNAAVPGHLEYGSMEWRAEWNIMVCMADATPNPPEANDLPYKSLEEFHIFVLANILRRPIIILAEDVLHNFEGHTFAPIHFSGIYLPLRWKPEECVRSPIVLGYLQQHFTPLLSQEEAPAPIGLATGEYAVPLVKHDLTMLTVQFLLEHEEHQDRDLLQKYLDLVELPWTGPDDISLVLAAKLNLNPPPEEQDLIKDFFQAVEKTYNYKEPEKGQEAGEAQKVAKNETLPTAVDKQQTEAGTEAKECSTPGCDMYGTPEQNGLCTTCFKESTVSKKPPGAARYDALPADLVPNSSMLMRECRTPGCQYFCSIATGEYCHECYEKVNADQHRREVEAGRVSQSAQEVPQPAADPNKCVTEGCNNDRNPDNENLCDVCFVSIVMKSDQPRSIQQLKQTERSSSLGTIPTTRPTLDHEELRTTSQSLGHISDFTNPAKCIIPECPRTGYPKTNDMCKKCYIDQQGRVAAAGIVAGGASAVVAGVVTTVAAVLTHISATFTSAKSPGGTCKTPGCEMFGAPEQDGFCSQHYLLMLGKKYRPKPTVGAAANQDPALEAAANQKPAVEAAANQQTVATAPQPPPDELHTTTAAGEVNDVTKAKYFKKCRTQDCLRVGHEAANGLCHECFTKESRIPDSNPADKIPSSQPGNLVVTGAEGNTSPQLSTQNETRPLGFELSSSSNLPLGPIDPQSGDSTKCLIEDCGNLKLENTGGRCYWCLKKGKMPASPTAVEPPAAPSSTADPPAATAASPTPAAAANPTPTAAAGDPQPVPSIVERSQCPAPHCDAYGDAMYNGLCSKCFHTLQVYHSKKAEAAAQQLPNGPHHSAQHLPNGPHHSAHPLPNGPHHSAHPLPNGPHHSSEELPANTVITAGHGASVVVTPGNVTVTTEEGGTVSVARTTAQVPIPDEPQLPCVNAAQGCEMFGTKEQMGFCFQCFCKHTSQPPVNQPPQPANQQAEQPPVNHPPQPANQQAAETPLRVLAEVAGASYYAGRFPRRQCVGEGCDMHGEPENLNMCSRCYLRHILEVGREAHREHAEVRRARDIEAHRAQNLHSNVEPPTAYAPRIIHATVQTSPYYPPPAYTPEPAPQPGYTSVVPEPQPSYAPVYHDCQLCATPNCPNIGYPDQEQLCTACFQRFVSLMSPRQVAPRVEPPAGYQNYTQEPAKSSALKRCRAEGCDNYGNSRCFGFCHGCYQANYAR